MNMHVSLDNQAATAESIGCIRDLLIAALGVIDDMQLPGEIGAHLDLTIHKLGAFLPDGEDAPFEALLT